jgi:hypothetical protein
MVPRVGFELTIVGDLSTPRKFFFLLGKQGLKLGVEAASVPREIRIC